MSDQGKPSAGALRAAKRLDVEGHIFSWHVEGVAQIIEDETAHTELLEAAMLARHESKVFGQLTASTDDRLEQAIAKAEIK